MATLALVATLALDGGVASCRVGLNEAMFAATVCVDFMAPRSREPDANVCSVFVLILLFFLVVFVLSRLCGSGFLAQGIRGEGMPREGQSDTW